MFFQSWVDVDRVLFNVVNNRAVGDIVIISGSPVSTEQEEDHDDHQRHEGGSAYERQDGGHVALNYSFVTIMDSKPGKTLLLSSPARWG